MYLGRGTCSGDPQDATTRGTDGSLRGQGSQNLPLAFGSTGVSVSVGMRCDRHSSASSLLPSTLPPTSGLALCPSHPDTDLGLGVLVPWGGSEALGRPQHLHLVPALSNLWRHSTQRWGWEEIKPLLPFPI